jgi:hypothetical protein
VYCVGLAFSQLAATLRPPPQGFHLPQGHEQRKEYERHVENHVFQIENAFAEVLHVRHYGQIIDHLGRRRRIEGCGPAQDPQQ